MPGWKARVLLGITGGLLVAGGFSAWVIIGSAIGGSDAVEGSGLSVVAVVSLYALAGLVGGGLVGLLLPIGRRLPGALLLGFLGLWPVYFGAAFLLHTRADWVIGGAIMATVASAVSGCGAAYLVWKDQRGGRL